LPLRGGASDKVGNRYERLWTVLALFDVLSGDADYIRIEQPGDYGNGAEFLLMRDGTREWHQVKRQRGRYQWTIRNLSRARVLEAWWPKIQDGDRCVFVSGTSAQELYELTERAAQAESWAEFDTLFLSGRHLREQFAQLCVIWGNCPGEVAFVALRQVSVHVIDEKQLKARVLDRAASLVDGDPAEVARLLAEMADHSLHRRVTAPDIRGLVAGQGYPLFQSKAGRNREQRATVTQQAFHDAVGANIYIAGGHNIISQRTGRPPSAGRTTGLLIGLAAVLVAGAAYLWSHDSGIPENFQTGPGAGIYVPPTASKKCGDVTPGALISPASNLFTDVSEIRALSIDGRSAFLMQGDFGDTAYDWVISDPDGDYGGMQLRWWMNDGEINYCTVTITNDPPAALARQGIRQISSMAMPAVLNGEPVSFQACVWYTARKGVIPSKCWPPD
jgi:hypothetical protein